MKKIELSSIVEKMNIGLNCFGICVKVNSENPNQLDFYNTNNILLHTQEFKVEINEDAKHEKSENFVVKINDGQGNETRYYFLNKKGMCQHYFVSETIGDENVVFSHVYTLNLIYDSDNENLTTFYAYTKDFNIIKEFCVSDREFKVESWFGVYSNSVNNGKRSIEYSFPKNKSTVPEFCMKEYVLEPDNSKERFLFGDYRCFRDASGRTISTKLPLSFDQFNSLALNILRHPRNKELINHTLDEMNQRMPGVKQFVVDNCGMYDLIMNSGYLHLGKLDRMIRGTIVKKCDFKDLNENYVRTRKDNTSSQTTQTN